MTDRAELFGQRWMEVVYTNPHLDYSLKHPTGQMARHIYADQKTKATKATITKLSKNNGLFFFFKAGCPYCHQFAPIVKQFAATYGWKVIAISLDGSTLPEFPDAKQNNGIAENLKVQSLPTLLAVNPDSGKVLPLSVGMTTIDGIEDRIRTLYTEGNLSHEN
jgi:conjugal transfer pilus assembly protein TraF